MTDAVLALSGISKAFAGVHAVSDVSLVLGAGRTLGLIGQNGAGKSTLMNIVGGVLRPDSGAMTLRGVDYAPRDARNASARGIAFIHQELNLFANLTIAENIFLQHFPRRRYGPLTLIDRAELNARTRELMSKVGLDLSPSTRLDRLSPGERQLVEIAKAMQLDAQVIILDEPTTSLTPREIERLFALIERFQEAGRSMIYISHILGDVMRLADDIAVLRDGVLVASGPKPDFTISGAIAMMVGRPVDQLYPPRRPNVSNNALLRVERLTASGVVKDVSFTVNAGEIVGVFGLMGSGRTELARIIFGVDPYESGEIAITGKRLGRHTANDSVRSGIAFVTEDRREEGLLMNTTISENIELAALPRFAVTPLQLIETTQSNAAVDEVVRLLSIKAASLRLPAKQLSGGNQQKVVLAKWLMARPSIFLLDEPTRGIDVGAKFEIYSIIERLAAEAAGILFISSELEELMAMADRILVMSRGEVVGQFDRPPFDRATILASAFRETGIAA